MKTPIYLDYNATTPHDPAVMAAMQPYLTEYFGNPSSSYLYGIQSKEAVENARKQVASLLHCDPSEIVFTSGGTESNNYALKGVAFHYRHKGNHIITTQIEHPAILEVCKYLEKNGFEITHVPVNEYGIVRVSDVEAAITSKTILITVMHANNEVGSIQPIADIADLAKNRGILIHTDAAQSIGKIPTDIRSLGVDLLSIAGHKVYAPKGIGALYIRGGVKLNAIIHGAGQEQRRRPGTENVLEIVGLGKACEIAKRDVKNNMLYLKEMRDRLHHTLKERIKNMIMNGHPDERLPNTLSVSFKGLDASAILSKIKDEVAASHSDTVEISHVLKAMNIPIDWARGTLRFSTGRMTTVIEIDHASEIIINAVQQLLEANKIRREN
jgi:cysteine desulfurase